MLKENVWILTKNPLMFQKLITVLRERFDRVKLSEDHDGFIKDMEIIAQHRAGLADHLLIVFVEYPLLNDIAKYLNSKMNPSSYILISFYTQTTIIPGAFANVFESINTDVPGFDWEFFLQKLDAEITDKNQILFLQNEVDQFYKIGKSLSSERDTVKLLDMIISSSINLTSSDAGTIYLVVDKETGEWSSIKNGDIESRMLQFVIAKNMSMDIRLETATFDISKESIVGFSAACGRSLRIDDVYSLNEDLEYKHNHSFDRSTGYVTRSILSIPMKNHEDEVLGVIQLINKKSTRESLDFTDAQSLGRVITFNYSDELSMNAVSGVAAVALQNALLYRDMDNLLQDLKRKNERLEQLSQAVLSAHEEERHRIAREVHDGPAQSIANLAFKMEIHKKHLETQSPRELLAEVDAIAESVRSTTREVRTIIYDLKPAYLEDGFFAALEGLIGNFRTSSNIEVAFTNGGDDSRVKDYVMSTLYRILQESLTNIHKHAEADRVEVKAYIEDSQVTLSVKDNGKGFDKDKVQQDKPDRLRGGYGLMGINERVELVKGKIEVESEPGQGTVIRVQIPLT
ncbi:MAG: ATP-binding protein [Acidobacteriota bacterium]